jgi:hypothetical protein
MTPVHRALMIQPAFVHRNCEYALGSTCDSNAIESFGLTQEPGIRVGRHPKVRGQCAPTTVRRLGLTTDPLHRTDDKCRLSGKLARSQVGNSAITRQSPVKFSKPSPVANSAIGEGLDFEDNAFS